MTINSISPGIIFILGAFISLLFKDKLKQFILLLIPVMGFLVILNLTNDSFLTFNYYLIVSTRRSNFVKFLS